MSIHHITGRQPRPLQSKDAAMNKTLAALSSAAAVSLVSIPLLALAAQAVANFTAQPAAAAASTLTVAAK